MTPKHPILTMPSGEQTQDIPYGFCHCGCGQKTQPSKYSHAAKNLVKGEPRRFVVGHARRKRENFSYSVRDMGFDTPCWMWNGHVNHNGYGKLYVDGGRQSAHRYYFEEANGPVPSGLHLDHLCRVRCCVNPDHLEPVTRTENNRRGNAAKLSRSDVAQIKARLPHELQVNIARDFGVDPRSISCIAVGVTWKDVEPDAGYYAALKNQKEGV